MALVYDPDNTSTFELPAESEFRAWVAGQDVADEHPADTLERWLQTFEPRAEVITRSFPQATGCWVNLPDAEGHMWTTIAPRWIRLYARSISDI